MEINLDTIKKIHFIGIGGIGISAIARLMHIKGKSVSGSDVSQSLVTEELSKLGIQVTIGHRKENVPSDVDLLIHTIAIPDSNPEILEAKSREVQTATYPQMLTVLSKNMYTIAVSGTHGKTTTTAMLSDVLIDAHFDPTVIVGSLLKNPSGTSSNLVVGESNYFLVEACEYRRSFLNIYPTILIITNIDEDHLDYYSDITDIQSAFRELALRIPKSGAIICNPSSHYLGPVLEGLQCSIIDYTKCNEQKFPLKIPGVHNQENAAAAYGVGSFLHIEKESIISSLKGFNGTWRRFDLKGKTKNGATVYDDYAHHPHEISAALQGLKEMYLDIRRIAVFQPHLFSRTKSLFTEFSESFDMVDEVYILPIYPAREAFDPSITSEMLVEKIGAKGHFIPTHEKAVEIIQEFDKNTVVMLIGAGDIYTISSQIAE